MTPTEAGHVLGLSSDTVRVLCDKGRLPALRTMSGRRLVRRADVERLAEERRRTVSPSVQGRGS
ncbi:helix-turn-helix domain-containing protein [Corallococcus terminator]